MFESIIRNPEQITIRCAFGDWTASAQNGSVKKGDICVETVTDGQKLKILVSAKDTEISYIRIRWNFAELSYGSVLGDAVERTYGDAGWQNMVPYKMLPWYVCVENDDTCYGYGVRVRAGAFCFWQIDPAGISLTLDVRNGASGVVLNGRTLTACEIVYGKYRNMSAFEAVRLFCKVMCTDPVFPDRPVYGANNWYYAYGNSSQREILEDTEYLMTLAEENENPPYMVIDDCWQKYRCNEYIGGPWVPNEKFSDMKELADQIRERGAVPGIWIRFLLDRSKNIPDEWRLSHNRCLDPSHPKVAERIKEDIIRICSWGYKLIKHDFSSFDLFGKWGFQMQPFVTEGDWHFYDRTRTSAEIVTQFYKLIYETAKPYGTIILGCNTIGHLGAGLIHISRTGDDTSGILWERTVRYGVNTMAYRMPQHRTFYDIDADCLGVTEELSWERNRAWAKLLAISGTPLFFSIKPGLLKKTEKEELIELLKLASKQECYAEPLDWKETMQPMKWKVGKDTYQFHWYEEMGLRSGKVHGLIWETYSMSDYFII